jgi:glycosyltransferase involved in cell wall biosynthesis
MNNPRMRASLPPLVSVIVPVYNVERYVDCCLDSVRGQTYDRVEIIVVEDCSTDASLTRLNPHLRDPRVRLIRHEHNSGLSAARNTGIEAATGDYVMFVDSDDAIAPGLVDACVSHAKLTGADVLLYDFVAFHDGDVMPTLELTASTAVTKSLERAAYFKLQHFAWGDRTYKLHSGTTSEYGRYVKYPGGAP